MGSRGWNNSALLGDYGVVDCDVAREALSARLDGEREPVPAPRVDEHLATCPRCSDWYALASRQAEELRSMAGATREHIASVTAPSADNAPAGSRWFAVRFGLVWRRWALAMVGAAQLALAAAQAFGVDLGVAVGHHGAGSGVHLLNESTAWSVALGAVMVIAALRPSAAAGLAGVLVVFSIALTAYVITDWVSGEVTGVRVFSHVPVVLGTLLALLVWRHDGRRPHPTPRAGVSPEPTDIVLPQNASRGRRRGHLWPTDGSAA
nr:zf-HC2 domain-containing protein [Mycolicibacterium elephantis]